MLEIDQSANQRFTSRLGLLLSVLGIAVGTGNIWRFPRIAAQCGGQEGAGSFLIAWLCFLFLWSIPLIIAEYVLGRKNRSGVLSTIANSAGSKFTWMGGFIGFVSTAIMFFYSVIVGWCIYYFVYIYSIVHLLVRNATASWCTGREPGPPIACTSRRPALSCRFLSQPHRNQRLDHGFL